MDNINVSVKSKNPAVEPKSLKELTAEIAEVKGTIGDIYESVEHSEQEVERLDEAYRNSDDFIIGPDNKMKRKPKAYAPAEYSGLGEIYLDKNMKFLGREFEEFVSNPNVPHPGESIGDPDGIVYDRVRQAFLGYRNIEGSRMYTDTWDEQEEYTAASGYHYLCTSTDTAYKWQNGDLVETAAINGNVLTQAMLDFEYTIYHIQYDYDLNGRTIEVPEGCVLQFEGGSLRNGALVGDKTKINTGIIKIFDSNISVSGTWDIAEAYPEWYGAVGDGSTDDTDAIQKTINSFNIIHFGRKVYNISSPIEIPQCVTISGEHNYFTYDPDFRTSTGYIRAAVEMDYMFYLKGRYVEIYNLALIGRNIASYGIYSDYNSNDLSNIYVHDVYINGFTSVGFSVSAYSCAYERITCAYCTTGFRVGSTYGNTSIVMEKCFANRCTTGFVFRCITYSSFNVLSCDHCVTAYSLTDIYGLTISNTGSEFTDNIFKLSGNFHCFTIDNVSASPNNNGNIFLLGSGLGGKITIKNILIDGTYDNRISYIIKKDTDFSSNSYLIEADKTVSPAMCDENVSIVWNEKQYIESTSLTPYPDYPDDLTFVRVGKAGYILKAATSLGRRTYKFGKIHLTAGKYYVGCFNERSKQSNNVNFWLSKSDWLASSITTVYSKGKYFTLEAETDVYFGAEIYSAGITFDDTLFMPYIIRVDGELFDTKRHAGYFDLKPTNVNVGYAYFCTDKQTTEGATNGIMIYHKGNGVWVDALGRTVS